MMEGRSKLLKGDVMSTGPGPLHSYDQLHVVNGGQQKGRMILHPGLPQMGRPRAD